MIIDGKRVAGLQSYKVKGREEYMFVWMNSAYRTIGDYIAYDAYTTVTDIETVPSCHCPVSADYLKEDAYAVSFRMLPAQVQHALREYVS